MEAIRNPEDIDFSKYWLILKRRWLPSSGIFLLVVCLSAVIATREKPVYEAQGKLLFKKQDLASTLITQGAEKIGQLESLSQQNTPVDTEAEVLRSIPLIEKTIATLNLKNQETGMPVTPESFIKSLTIKGIKGTDILLISYTSPNPKESADVVNQLIRAYIENNILSNRSEATAARKFISEQLPRTEIDLRKAEVALRVFDEKNNIINLQDEAKSAVDSIALLNQKITEVASNLENTTSQTAALQTKLGLTSEGAMLLNTLSQSPAVQPVLKELQEIENTLPTQRTLYREEHPTIVQLEKRKAVIKTLLQERVAQIVGNGQIPTGKLQAGESEQRLIDSFVATEVARLGLTSQVQSLLQAQSAYRERANLLPQLNQIRRDLERQVETAKSKYEILVKRLQEVQIAENQNVGNARVVASASPAKIAVASKKTATLAGGIIIGALLYIVTAFVLDLRDPSIKTAKEARELLKYPWLGMIPMRQKKQGWTRRKDLELSTPVLPVRDKPHALESEAYRMLQSNLKFLKPDQTIKTIVVTSSVSKEGKSTVSANLAMALAQMGRRVLLVDADLHYPMQHHIWGLTNAVGLSDVIVNQAKQEEAVKPVHEYLSVLPAGAIPPNPLALIDSNRMNSLVQNFSANYDFVIFDTPPLVLVSDVLMLGRMTDGILLVVRPGVVDTASATTAKAQLTQSGLEVLGLVINGVVVGQEPDNYLRHVQAYHEDAISATAIRS